MLHIAADHRTLMNDDKPFFYLADTCWSAFTNITDEEWDYYLQFRKTQGFNTIQINILPQWDASQTSLNHHPFNDGYELNDEYFSHAKAMAEKAKSMGFELALVVLWCNYVPDTWANAITNNTIPKEVIKPYVYKVHETFSHLNPIYVISGDTDFNTEETTAYYLEAAEILKKLAPQCLFTTHIKGRLTQIPPELVSYLDIIWYQSGHNGEDKGMPYKLAEEMMKYNKPLINSEPCYEEMGYSRMMYNRWSRYDVRRAAYMSLLSGACAGITYGAAGIYNWHKGVERRSSEGFMSPKRVEDALHLPGAEDYAYIRFLWERYGITQLTPNHDVIDANTDDIRAATDDEHILIYVPVNCNVRMNIDLTGYTIEAIDLKDRRIMYPLIKDNTLPMTLSHEDTLFILTAK